MNLNFRHCRSNPSKVFLKKVVLKICIKFTGEHPCRSVISIKLYSNFIEITLWHGCSAVNLLHIFRTLFPKNTSGWLLLSLLLFLDLDHSVIVQIFFCISFLICFVKYKLPLSRIMSETKISV